MKKHLPELLAPVGSFEALHAAIKAGADAVYFGLEELHMRARAAKPFSRDDLHEIVRICHQGGVKPYLALNTILYDEELERMHTLCLDAKEQGISAVIVQDPAAMTYARGLDLEVHLSTQVNVSNLEAVRFYAQWADVIIPARELNLQQIRILIDQILRQKILGPSGRPVRIELFIHGALCLAVAGRCAMSLALTGHSANRGDCLQICRRRYRVIDEETGDTLVVDNPYVFSPKDLCTIPILDRIVETGVSILKIEGRGRSADYVFTVTETYREALHAIERGEFSPERAEQWKRRLETVFNRGFWTGYYLGEWTEMWSGTEGSVSTEQKILVGPVVNYYGRIGVAEVHLSHTGIHLGDTVLIMGPTTGIIRFTVESLYVNDVPSQEAPKGAQVTLQVPEKIRRGDKLYLLKHKTPERSSRKGNGS